MFFDYCHQQISFAEKYTLFNRSCCLLLLFNVDSQIHTRKDMKNELLFYYFLYGFSCIRGKCMNVYKRYCMSYMLIMQFDLMAMHTQYPLALPCLCLRYSASFAWLLQSAQLQAEAHTCRKCVCRNLQGNSGRGIEGRQRLTQWHLCGPSNKRILWPPLHQKDSVASLP